MNTKLQDNIKSKLSVKKLSVSELERRAGLKQSTVQNILHGRSRNPSIETIKSIAQELNCSIEELIGELSILRPTTASTTDSRSFTEAASSGIEDQSPWNASLFIKAIQTVQIILDKKNITLPKKQVLASIDEIYRYSIGVSEEIDQRFAEWIVEKILKNRSDS